MTNVHPLDILRGYRLGSRQATVELQRTDIPNIHIDFEVFKLIDAIKQQPGQAIILTGTAGDGKTYLAYRILDALNLDKVAVRQAQAKGGYDLGGFYIDLDLSAGELDEKRQKRLYRALTQPDQLTLVCANEGKLDELQNYLQQHGLSIPETVLRINLSHRALISPDGWRKVLAGLLLDPMWQNLSDKSELVARNRMWLADQEIAERLRRYLLLPYLLGEPITIRETLSFLAYGLGSGLSAVDAQALDKAEPGKILPHLLFNAIFSEPAGYTHGGRATPNEKLLWWLFRFDPAIQASPEIDLNLLVNLDDLDVTPPPELLTMWQDDLIVRSGETSDTEYRRRLSQFMRYARRWYTFASGQGFSAYFPFRHFRSYLDALNSTSDDLEDLIPGIVQGLNTLLSGGQEVEKYGMKIFYLPAEEIENVGAIYSAQEIDIDDFVLLSDLADEVDDNQHGDIYLERLPRRLYFQYKDQPEIRLPISLLLYEVLMSSVDPGAGFPATLWAKERDTVARFMSLLSQCQEKSNKVAFRVFLDAENSMELRYNKKHKNLSIS